MRSSLSSWKQTLAKLGRRAKPRRSVKQGAAYRRRSSIERLEDRNLLSLTVNTTFDENDGYDVGNRSLREAIAKAATPTQAGTDTIQFDASLAGKTIELDDLGQITIDSDVNIVGLGAGSLVVDANGSEATPRRIFTINADKSVTISGLTMTGGHVTGTSDGGAIYNSGTLRLEDVVLSGNYANDKGGAIYNSSGELTIIDSTLEQNQAGVGAGIYYNRTVADPGYLNIIGSAFLHNDAFWNGQSGSNYGGGLFIYSFGSAPHASAYIANTTFSGNTAQFGAGVVTSGYPTLQLVNSTITNNAASYQGGGIFNAGGTADITLHNTILAGNTAAISTTRNFSAALNAASSYNLVGPGSTNGLNSTTLGNQLNVVDPGLGVLDDHGGPTKTHALLPGSLAIDKGRNDRALDADENLLNLDQRGFTRFVDSGPTGPLNGIVDIGAVEWHRPLAIGDFDGDGRDDEAFLGYGTALYVASKPNGKLQISKWADLSFLTLDSWQVGDFNDDGRDDLAFRAEYGLFDLWAVAFSESTQFNVTLTTIIAPESLQHSLVGDFDGDGRDELIGRYDANFDDAPDKWSLIDYDQAGHFSQYDIGTPLANGFYTRVHAGDVNGDGRDDLVAYQGDDEWDVAITSLIGGRVQLPTTATNVGNWFRDPWVDDAGTAAESIDIEGPYRRLLEIFSKVYNEVELELYPGLMKGIQATAETKAGNPWDQAALLVDRLDAEGFQSKIVFGTIDAPLNEVREWLGVTSDSVPHAALNVIRAAFDGNAALIANNTAIRFKHAWVKVSVPTINGLEQIHLDPSWKFKARQPGESVNLVVANGNYVPETFDIDGRSARGTFDEFGYLADAGENQLPIEWYEDQVMKYLAETGKNKSLADVAYDGPIRQAKFTGLPVIAGNLLGGSAVISPGTNPESFENLTEILGSTTLKNRFVHQATISLSREKHDEGRSIALSIPGDEGQIFASDDDDAPNVHSIDATASTTPYNAGGMLGVGYTEALANGARRIYGTKAFSIAIPDGYTITPNTRLQVTYNGNAIAHGLVLGWDNDNAWENSQDRLSVTTIASGTHTAVLTQGGTASYSADRIVLGLRHANHYDQIPLSTSNWIDISNVRMFEASTGTATVTLDAANEKNIRQQGKHYLSLDAAGLNYQVTSNSILEIEFKAGVTGTLHAVGWDVDDSSANDAGQASRRFRLAGSSSSYQFVAATETLPDGYQKLRLPIGQGVGNGQSALLDRLIFYTDGGPTTESLFRNLKLTTDLGVAGEHWVSPSLAMPHYSLSQITIDYIKTENSIATTDDDTYRSRLWVGEGGTPFVEGAANEILQLGDTASIRIQHQSPTEFGTATGASAADRTYERKPGQIHAIGFDANQYSRQHLVRLQAGLNTLLSDGDDVSDIDEMLTYASAKYWHDFNLSNEIIDGLMQTVGAQQWVGSGFVTADPILIGGDLSHLNFPIAPLNMGVDLPNSTHASYESQTGNLSNEAFQLMGWNASALENAVVEELINAESISTIRGLQYGFEDSLYIFESFGDGNGPPTIYLRGATGENVAGNDDPAYAEDRTDRPIVQALNSSDNQALEYWLADLSTKVIEDIWAALNEATAVGDTVRVIAPRLHNSVGVAPLAWEGAVYVAEVNKATSKSGRYTIVPFDGSAPSSGGYSGNTIAPINLNLPKLNDDFRTWAGDPVSVANGNMFRDEVDITYSNLGVPLNFARHYESGSKYDIGLGTGWTHSFSDRIIHHPEVSNEIEWLTSTGNLLKFTKVGSVWVPPDSRFGQFSETATTFLWKGADGMEYHFKKVTAPLDAGDGKYFIGRLEKIVDRDGHGVLVTYTTTTGFTLSQVQDIHEAGRRLQFAYSGTRIASVTRIATGAANASWTYAYNAASGELAANTRLATVTSPSDIHSAPIVTEYHYANSGPSLGLISKIIEPDGGYHEYEYFANGRVFRVTESVDLRGTTDEGDDIVTSQTFNYNLFRELTEFTDENGKVETYLHDENGQLLRQIHDDRSRLVYEYGTEANNESALMVKATDERGAFETFTYFRPSDSGQPGYSGRRGELKEHTDKSGVTTKFEYWAHPYISELTKTVATAGGTNIPTLYTRDSVGHLTSVTDTLGNRTDYEYFDSFAPAQLHGLRLTETRALGASGAEAALWRTLDGSFEAGNTLTVRVVKKTAGKVVVADAIRIDRMHVDGTFTRVIDNTDPDFRTSGSGVTTSTASPKYGTDATIISAAAPVGSSATWIFHDLLPGTYRISANWSVGADRDPQTEYQIFNGLPGEVSPSTVQTNQSTSIITGFNNHQTIYNYDGEGNLTSAVTDQLPSGESDYDQFGRPIGSNDATGVETFSVYDVLGRTVSAGLADPDLTGPLTALATTFVYDARGRLVKTTDALNRITESQYDLKGRLVKQTFADGTAMEYGYDGKGNRTSITDELGRKTTFVYDDRDRVIQTIHPDGASERVQYDGAGNVTATIDALGRRSEFTYDKAGRLLTTTFAAGTMDPIQTSNNYDTLGRLIETTDANGNKTKYRHDALGRVVETRVLDKTNSNLPPKFLSTTEYDANGRVVRTTVYDAALLLASVASGGAGLSTIPADPTTLIDGLGDSEFLRVTETRYDSFDRPVEMTYADGTSASTIYDAAGRVRYQVDELGRRTELTYDEYGRLAETIAPDPDGAFGPQLNPVTEYEYDAVGNVVTIVDPRDFETTREFDARNRLVAETDGVGSVRRMIYDVAGQIVATIDPRGSAAWSRYDDRGRPVLEQLVDPDGAGAASAPTIRRTYDDVGNVSTSTDALGNTTWFEYDSLNRLRVESRNETLITDDAEGGDANFSASAGAEQTQHASAYGRDYTLLDFDANAEAAWTFSDLAAGSYDVSMTWLAESVNATAGFEVFRNGVLIPSLSGTRDQTQSPNSFFAPHGNHELGWEFLAQAIPVAAGDTLKIVVYGDPDSNVIADAVRIDRLVSSQYAYDKNGNLLNTTDTLGHTSQFIYDELNRQVQTISADPDGTPTTLRSLVTDLTYDGFGNIVSEKHARLLGNPILTQTTRYSSLEVLRTDAFAYDQRDRLTAEILDAGTSRLNITTQYAYDDAGNTVLVTDAEGFQTHYRYDGLNRLIDEYQDFGEGRGEAANIMFDEQTLHAAEPSGNIGTVEVSPDGFELTLTDDMWIYAPIDPYMIDFRTVLEFELTIENPADYILIAYDTDALYSGTDDLRYLEIGGRETSEGYYNLEFRSETVGEPILVHIPIGQYLTQAEKLGLSINQLIFYTYTNGVSEPVDKSQITFSNVRLYQSDEVRTVTTYDAAGNVETVRTASDPRNITTRYEYDGVGRQTREILDAGSTGGPGGPMERSYSTMYDASGNVLVQRNDTAGTETVHQYDTLNRLTRTTLPDPDGNPATFNGLMTKFAYDTAGQLVRTINGENEKTYTDYDAQGRVLTETDGNGDQTHYRYDSEGNLLSIIDAEENVTRYTYDALDRLATEVDAFDSRLYVYDKFGRLSRIYDHDSQQHFETIDALGRVTLERWRNAATSVMADLTWEYDKLGRVTKEVMGSHPTTVHDVVNTYEYDGLGRLIAQANYDPNDLTLGANIALPKVRQTYQYEFQYVAGEFEDVVVRSQLTSSGLGIAHTRNAYDRLGRLSKITDSDALSGTSTPQVATKSVGFAYDTQGNLNNVFRQPDDPNSFDLTWMYYDQANRVAYVQHLWQGGEDATTHEYAYDKASRVTSFNTHTTSATTVTTAHNYAYDNAGQLTSKTGGTTESYGYDDNGNRIYASGQEILTGPGNRLLEDDEYTYEYDAEGNLTKKDNKFAPYVIEYTWDYGNRLTQIQEKYSGIVVEQTNYTYDAQGHRVRRTHDADGAGSAAATKEFYVYDGADLAMTFGNAGEFTHRYLYGPQVDQVLVDEVFTAGQGGQRVSDEVLWQLADHQGTIRDVVDDTGTLRKHVEYDSFGLIKGEQFYAENGSSIGSTHAEAVDQLFGFQGQERDEATKLQYHSNGRRTGRWYDPAIGRWLSEDPEPVTTGGDINSYRAFLNDPNNNLDPSGGSTLRPTDYLPALNNPSFTYSTGLSASDFTSYNSWQYSTAGQVPRYTSDFSQEVIKTSHLPKGSYTATKTDDFGQTLIHARTPGGQTYAFDPATGVRDDRVLQRQTTAEGNTYNVFAVPGWRTDIQEGPGTFSLAIDAAATYSGYFAARAAARPLAHVAKNVAVNIYENVVESYLPGIGLLNGRPNGRNLDDVSAPGTSGFTTNPNNRQLTLWPDEPYNRQQHYGATPTQADRAALGAGRGQVVDHNPPLVQRYYQGDPANSELPGFNMTDAQRRASAADRSRMGLQTELDSQRQGSQMSGYSKNQKRIHGF